MKSKLLLKSNKNNQLFKRHFKDMAAEFESMRVPIHPFKFISTMDYSDARTQIFILMLLSNMAIQTFGQNVPNKNTKNDENQRLSEKLTNNQPLITDPSVYHNHSLFAANENFVELITPFDASVDILNKKALPRVEKENLGSEDILVKSFAQLINFLKHRSSRGGIKDIVPEFNHAFTDFYQDTTYFSCGSAHPIYSGMLISDRNNVKAGTKIAIRVSETLPRDERTGLIARYIHTYATLSIIKSSGISNYIPEIYSVYYATGSANVKEGKSIDDRARSMAPTGNVFCAEMEWMETSYPALYQNTGQIMEIRTVFEEVIGMWAVEKIAKCYINDANGDEPRHHLYNYDKNPIIYHIGDELYAFDAGYSPRRIDYDDSFIYENPEVRPFTINPSSCSYLFDDASPSIIKFLTEINSKGLFCSIKTNLAEFKISKENVNNYPNANHFYITEQHLALENTHTCKQEIEKNNRETLDAPVNSATMGLLNNGFFKEKPEIETKISQSSQDLNHKPQDEALSNTDDLLKQTI